MVLVLSASVVVARPNACLCAGAEAARTPSTLLQRLSDLRLAAVGVVLERLPVVLGDRGDRIFDPEQNCRRTLIEYCQPAHSKWPMSSAPLGRGGMFN